MKTPAQLIAAINAVAPSIALETIWSYDETAGNLHDDCPAMKDENPDDWRAWQSEVRASAIVGNKVQRGSAYLGATWERAGADPAESNPDISGYFPQMLLEAIEELGSTVSPALADECFVAVEVLKKELAQRWEEQAPKYEFTFKFRGRRKGAIGIFHDCEMTAIATDERAAALKLYDTHEHITLHGKPIVKPVTK